MLSAVDTQMTLLLRGDYVQMIDGLGTSLNAHKADVLRVMANYCEFLYECLDNFLTTV